MNAKNEYEETCDEYHSKKNIFGVYSTITKPHFFVCYCTFSVIEIDS